jgi:diaminopimelate decarboxylase
VLGSADPDKPIVVCGRTCSEQDYFVQVAATPGAAVPRVGDWVVLGMSSYSLELESTFGGLAPLPRTLVPA